MTTDQEGYDRIVLVFRPEGTVPVRVREYLLRVLDQSDSRGTTRTHCLKRTVELRSAARDRSIPYNIRLYVHKDLKILAALR